MKRVLFLLLASGCLQHALAQVSISNPPAAADPSAMLEIKSTNRGLLLPRLANRTDVVAPATGLMVYETASNAVWIYNGSGWVQLGGGGSSQWLVNGTHIYNGNSGNVGIGISAPTAKLHLAGLMKINGGQIDIDDNIAQVRLIDGGSPKGYFKLGGSSGDIEIGTNVTSNTTGKLNLETQGFPRLTIEPAGNIGIGTINPQYKLDVVGVARIRDNVLIDDGYIRMFNTSDSKSWEMRYSTSLGGRLLFMQQGFERMILRNDGNVGIGGDLPLTNNGFPQTKLHIETGQDAGLTSTNNGYLMLGNGAGSNIVIDNNEIVARDGFTTASTLYLQNNGGELMSGARFTINKDGEALKLNGNAPLARFYQNNASKASVGIDADGNMQLVTTGGGALFLTPSTASVVLNPNNGGGVVISPTGGGNITMSTQSGGDILMNPNGLVTIGSGISTATAAGYKLAIRGKVICEELRVKLYGNWPDYVFQKNYQLMPLSQLQHFIRQNNHLPNIPSAAEVEKEGIVVGEMNKKLLEKVEELTLYILDLQKQIDELKAARQQNK